MPSTIHRMAVCLVAVLILLPAAAPGAGGDSESILRKVPFTFAQRDSYRKVYLAGTFNGWNAEATPMKKEGAEFVIDLFLPVGEYQYKFVADGQWITDEMAVRFQPDGYGGQNSVVVVDDSFEAVPLEVGDGRIVTEHLGHGQNAWEVMPAADGGVSLRTRVWTGDVEGITVRWRSVGSGFGGTEAPSGAVPMERVDGDGLFD